MSQSKSTSYIKRTAFSFVRTTFKDTTKNRRLLVGVLIVISFVIASTIIFQQQTKAPTEFKSSRISFEYPKYYEKQSITDPAKNQAKTLIGLESDNPEALIVLAEEKNAIRGANLLKKKFLDYLEQNAARKFPIVYRGYKKQKTERIEISEYTVSLISFSYTGTDRKSTVYVNFFIIPLYEDAYYLTIQSPDKSTLVSETEKIQPTIEVR